MKIEKLADLFIDEIQDIYSAETQLLLAMPQIANAVSSTDLRDAFLSHLEQTKEHVQRIEEIFSYIEGSPKGKKSFAGLIKEGKELLTKHIRDEVLDAALIGSAQCVEHYEIASDGAARTHAAHLGYTMIIGLLEQTRSEEKFANEKLNWIAENRVNEYAL